MTAVLLDGRLVARDLRARARDELQGIVARLGATPVISIVNVGDNPSAMAYEKAIIRAASGIEMKAESVHLSDSSTQDDLNRAIDRLNDDPSVHGIILLQPLPPHLDRVAVSDRLDPLKDIDGITTFNAGRIFHDDRDVLAPSTPAGGMALLKHYDIEIAGRHAVVVGRSPVVGKPMSLMLLAANATVSICHSRTPDLAEFTKQADILVSAVGRPGTIQRHMVKPGAVVVDFGVNFVDSRMIGDVDFHSVKQVAGGITPVPGGTGRVTTMVLVRNTMKAMRLQAQNATAGREFAGTHQGKGS
jgi:methylenetetrahydrofolate dehydrogenase (NADP+)/methenyltetrahydrofolate cyclohydrolase